MTQRVYQALLWVYPREFRDEYGPQLVHLVHDRVRDEGAGVRLWAHLFGDLVATALTPRLEVSVTRTNVVRAGGALASLGGVLWIAWASLAALRPAGTSWQYRDLDDIAPLSITAFVLIAVGGVAVVATRATGRGLAPWVGAGAFALGAALAVMSALGFSWWLFFAGFLVFVLGSVALGVAVLRRGLLPQPIAIALIVGPILMFFMNTEDARVLLVVPMGLAWLATGATLAVRPPAPPTPAEA